MLSVPPRRVEFIWWRPRCRPEHGPISHRLATGGEYGVSKSLSALTFPLTATEWRVAGHMFGCQSSLEESS
jgi:hypothetical protein